MADTEAIKKAREFAETAFAPASDRIAEDSARELHRVAAELAARGLVQSGAMSREILRILSERIQATLQARADALLEGFELHGVPVDDGLGEQILDELGQLRTTAVAAARNSNRHQPPGLEQLLKTDLERASWQSMKVIKAHIERRRLMQSRAQSGVTNVYYVYGHNPRWNVNSNDQSVNVVTVSNQQIFAKLRSEISTHVPAGDEQEDILDRITALEQAHGDPSFAQKYADFISAAANHMTILAPFIPALTEMLRKALGG